jgi:hypothetical protein
MLLSCVSSTRRIQTGKVSKKSVNFNPPHCAALLTIPILSATSYYIYTSSTTPLSISVCPTLPTAVAITFKSLLLIMGRHLKTFTRTHSHNWISSVVKFRHYNRYSHTYFPHSWLSTKSLNIAHIGLTHNRILSHVGHSSFSCMSLQHPMFRLVCCLFDRNLHSLLPPFLRQ